MFSVARTLSATEWRYLIVAWIALPLIDLRLRRQGYARRRRYPASR